MPSYTQERKAAILNKLLPPNNGSVADIAQEEGITVSTLYQWLKQHKQQETGMLETNKSQSNWNTDAKFAMLLEAAPLNTTEVGEYCRRKGIYPEQLNQWRRDCLNGLSTAKQNQQALDNQLKTAQQHIRNLEKDLRRKEKALAESAALLVLQKKFQALWEEKGA